MPIFMDIHIVPGIKAKDAAEAHRQDILLEEAFGCKCMTYWIDEARGNAFCLISAPDLQSVEAMHRQAHGLIPGKIIEVNPDLVTSFLGRIYDPPDALLTADGLKVFEDPSFRTLMVVKMPDPVLLQLQLGKEETATMFNNSYDCISNEVSRRYGSNAGNRGDAYIASFTSAPEAFHCALTLHRQVKDAAPGLTCKIALAAGEPVDHSSRLFGDTVDLAEHLCLVVPPSQIAVAAGITTMLSREVMQHKAKVLSLTPGNEKILHTLLQTLAMHWQDTAFTVDSLGRAIAMSNAGLYRKTVELFGIAPNQLIKAFRLEKAKDLIRQQRHHISRIAFESGYTSPSYFTKCFKEKFGVLPLAYSNMHT